MRLNNRVILMLSAICAVLLPAVCRLALDVSVAPHAAAQSGPPATPRTMKKGDLFTELSRSRIESILDEPIPDVKFQGMPLKDVLGELKKLTGISMYFDLEELGDVIDPDVPVTLDLAENSMTFKTMINEFILGPNDLVYLIRGNFLKVMSYDKSLTVYEVVVYNCRDLLVGIPVQPPAVPPAGDSGDAMTDRDSFSDIGAREEQLIEIIRLLIRDEDSPWDDGAGVAWPESSATIEAFNGLLVVQGRRESHEQLQQLLRLLRESAQEQDWPADLGTWPHSKRISPPAIPPTGGGVQRFGGGGVGVF